MLTPEQLKEIADTMYPLLSRLTDWITKDIIERMIACMARSEAISFGETDKWQIILYQAAAGHYEALSNEIRKWTGKSEEEVRQIFMDAGMKAWEADNAFYVSHGLESVQLLKNEHLMNILVDCYQRTNGEIKNFTRTIAGASQQRFIQLCDDAHMKVMTGAQSYTGAMIEAVNDLSEHQLKIKYPSGHVDTIETAVLRCIRTGTAQASGNMTIQAMKDNGWDLVRVSAHLGARYGDGGENPGNHAWWQGKLYSLSGTSAEYPPFRESTGYGTGPGLSGWNCRHSFGPGDPEHNPFQSYDDDENKKAYDLSQVQRSMERGIRKAKRKVMAAKAAVDAARDEASRKVFSEEYEKAVSLLQSMNKEYQKFCKDNGLRVMTDRLNTAKWNRAQAKAALRTETMMDNRTRDAV